MLFLKLFQNLVASQNTSTIMSTNHTYESKSLATRIRYSIPGVYRIDVGLVQESSMLLLVSEATMLVDVARREDDMKY